MIFDCVRDTRELATLELGVLALAPHPRKSVKRGVGEKDLAVSFAGVRFYPGGHLYADEDGLIVAPNRLL